jgi:hypothetical protein
MSFQQISMKISQATDLLLKLEPILELPGYLNQSAGLGIIFGLVDFAYGLL